MKKTGTILWISFGVLSLATILAQAAFLEQPWVARALALLWLANSAAIIWINRKSLRGRTAAFGLQSLVTTLLIIAIVGVLNFLAQKYPLKKDLTQNQAHTLADQTQKLVKGLSSEVKAILFGENAHREQFRTLLENYQGLNPKFTYEFVNFQKEPSRVQAAGVTKPGTILLQAGQKTSKVEEITEEKLTNALIKLLKDKVLTLCHLVGHGEKDLEDNGAGGFVAIKTALQDQSYSIQPLNLLQGGEIPKSCDAIVALGPTKPFFGKEIEVISNYLSAGGRGIFTLEVGVKGKEPSPEYVQLIEKWGIKPVQALTIDPLSRLAEAPIVLNFSKASPITREFTLLQQSPFPVARPLERMPNTPQGVMLDSLALTGAQAWGETDFQAIAQGQAQYNEGKDGKGPITLAMSVEKRDPSSSQKTRIVVFGSTGFANNQFSRFGGNLDLFMNAANWILEDESSISIRKSEEDPGKLEMSRKARDLTFFIAVLIIPLLIAASGVVVWWMRRKL